MGQNVTTTLPNREEMLQRLLNVWDDPHITEWLYPILLGSAGYELDALGVISTILQAINDYSRGMPEVTGPLLHHWVPQWIDALAINPEVADKAKALLQKTLPAI